MVLVFFLYVKVSHHGVQRANVELLDMLTCFIKYCMILPQTILAHSYIIVYLMTDDLACLKRLHLALCLQTINTGSLAWATANALGYYYMVSHSASS